MGESLSDEELMQAYVGGDSRAFEELYRRHAPRVTGYLRGKTRDDAWADDLCQATFLKLHQTRVRFDSSYPFLPWLFTICRSVMVDGLRKRERTPEDLNPLAVESARAPEPGAKPERGIPDLGQLPAAQREGLELRYGMELSFDEIAARLKTTPSNARQLVSRAVRALKRAARREGQNEED